MDGCWDLKHWPNTRKQLIYHTLVSWNVCLAQTIVLYFGKERGVECRGIMGWLLRLEILTDSSHNQYPTHWSCANYHQVQTTVLSLGKHRVAEVSRYYYWDLQYIQTPCTSYLPDPAPTQIFVWHNPHFCLLGKIDVQSAENSWAACWDFQYIHNPRAQLIYHTIDLLEPAPNFFVWNNSKFFPLEKR